MKKLSIMISIFLSLGFVLNSITVNASEHSSSGEIAYSEVPTIGTPAPDLTTGYTPMILQRAAKGITMYRDCITYDGTTVYYSGETYATHIASKIGNKALQLEVWDGYMWQNITTNSYYTENAAYYTASRTYTGTVGKYYRVAGSHLVIIDGVTYTTTMNYSDYICIEK